MPVESHRYAALVFPAALLLAVAGCPDRPTHSGPVPSSSLPSPNASILPAPLKPASELPSGLDGGTDRAATTDAARPRPTTLREDVPPATDNARLVDTRGVRLNARFRWHGLPAPPTGSEVNPEAIAIGRHRTDRTLTIDLSPEGRLRLEFTSPTFPLPPGSELRARLDHYGHVLVWPDGASYRILQPGTLRALFQEGRADVAPLVLAEVGPVESTTLLGQVTSAQTVSTSLGRAVLHQAAIPEAGAGELLCRVLVELLSAKPSPPPCLPDLVPLRAEFDWEQGGRLTFEVTSLDRTAVLDPEGLLVPPRTPSFKADRLPRPPRATLLDEAELAAFRRRALPTEPLDAGLLGNELVATNSAETIRYLLVDGVPVVRVPPRSERRVTGLLAGRYVLSWMDFLGTRMEPARPEQLPLRIELGGAPDAGVPEP